MCNKGFIWNASDCECACDKLCDVGEYLNYKNCNCKKMLIDELVEECIENIDGNGMIIKIYADLVQYTLYYLPYFF